MNRTMLFRLFASVVLMSAVPALALEVGDHAPCVELKNLQPTGEIIEQCIRTKEPGTSFVLIEFFSTSCGDCSRNLPKLSALSTEIAQTTTTRIVGIDRDENALLFYLSQHAEHIHFPAALDTERTAKKLYGVNTTPTMFILNSDNIVVYKFDDVLTEEQNGLIRALVGVR